MADMACSSTQEHPRCATCGVTTSGDETTPCINGEPTCTKCWSKYAADTLYQCEECDVILDIEGGKDQKLENRDGFIVCNVCAAESWPESRAESWWPDDESDDE